jgi:hypothetical protein
VDAAAMRGLRRADARPADAVAAGAPAAGAAPNAAAPDAAAPHVVPPPPPPAAPLSTLALLEGVLRAVQGDAAGRVLRAAVLDLAAEAARAAGRPLPPGAHALRARLAAAARAGGPAVMGGEAVGGGAEDSESAGGEPDAPDGAVAAHAAALVRDLQRTTPGYDDLFAPLHDDALADLVARHALAVHPAPAAAAGTRFVLTPPLFGRRRLVLAAAARPDQRRLVLRAALAACAAGHAGDDAPLASPPPPALARACDLAALADLVPFWQLAELRRRGRLGWKALAEHVAALAAALAGDWDPARAADRGRLRVALFREHDL